MADPKNLVDISCFEMWQKILADNPGMDNAVSQAEIAGYVAIDSGVILSGILLIISMVPIYNLLKYK